MLVGWRIANPKKPSKNEDRPLFFDFCFFRLFFLSSLLSEDDEDDDADDDEDSSLIQLLQKMKVLFLLLMMFALSSSNKLIWRVLCGFEGDCRQIPAGGLLVVRYQFIESELEAVSTSPYPVVMWRAVRSTSNWQLPRVLGYTKNLSPSGSSSDLCAAEEVFLDPHTSCCADTIASHYFTSLLDGNDVSTYFSDNFDYAVVISESGQHRAVSTNVESSVL